MQHGMENRGMHEGEMMRKGMMMERLKKILTEDEMKELGVKKLDMKITMLEQKVEYYKWIRDKIKSKI